MTRIEPGPGRNAPWLELHDALCRCTECWEKRKDKPPEPVTVVAWAPLSEKARQDPEPFAVLEYGGVRVELPLTYVHSMVGSFDRQSSFEMSGRVVEAALHEIEVRMWRDVEARRKKTP